MKNTYKSMVKNKCLSAVGVFFGLALWMPITCSKKSKNKMDVSAPPAGAPVENRTENGEPVNAPPPGSDPTDPSKEMVNPTVVLTPVIPAEPGFLTSSKNVVLWKRGEAVKNDIMAALEFAQESEFCAELGYFSCFDKTHLAVLGGHDPFSDQAQLTSVVDPLPNSPLVVDRMIMFACSKRVELDSNSQPKVFTILPPTSEMVDLSKHSALMDSQNTELFKRFMARTPSSQELKVIRDMASGNPVTLKDYAKMSCFVVGTHIETNFF